MKTIKILGTGCSRRTKNPLAANLSGQVFKNYLAKGTWYAVPFAVILGVPM